MRLVLLDTNIIVSAAIQRLGPSSRIGMEVLDGRVQAVTCPALVGEYRRVVRRPRLARFGLPPQWLDFLVENSLQLPDPPSWPVAGPDPDDLYLLSLAKSAGAILVTGNLGDFPAKIRKGVKVLSPAAYLDLLLASQE